MLADVKNPALLLFALMLAMAATMRAAQADDDEEQGKAPRVSNAKWVSECGARHTMAESGDFNEHNVMIPGQEVRS